MQVETLLKEIVVHRLYGEGIIEAVDGNRITVVFEDTKKMKIMKKMKINLKIMQIQIRPKKRNPKKSSKAKEKTTMKIQSEPK